ncbi:MAG: hypothetical protein EA343_14070 [Nodularia sp. (in: Bacteria)]|nr:MAG: hypothetical protein EA343_14070 [Nodularia sp. (in: cyanobacteria)]
MCNNNKIFIHAGWNKTATTFLQRNLFVPIFGEGLIGPNTQFNDLQRKSPEQPLLISDESILGVTIFKRNSCRNIQRFNFLDNWAKIAPNTQFILGVRKHDDFIESLYRQYLHVGGDMKAENFIDIHNNNGFIKVEELLYEPILMKLFSLFPRQHLIYDFDLFKTNPNILITELFSFIGLDLSDLDELLGKAMNSNSENSSVGYKSASALRVVNKFVSSPLFPNKPIPKSFFRFMALGKTPRELFQSLPKEKVKRRLTQNLYESLRDKLDLDWKAIETSYVNISNVKSK